MAPVDKMREGATSRVLLVTIRGLNPHAAWCSNYEFEDVIRHVDDVDVLQLAPARRASLRERFARSMAWRGISTHLNPGVETVHLKRDYDLLVFVCMNVWDLLYLNAIGDWRARCKTKVCYMVEFYAGQAGELDPLLRRLSEFELVAQSFSGSVAAVARLTGRPCHHVALAADVLRFTPHPDVAPRVIDVLSIGRRSEPVHQALLRESMARRLYYVHDTIPGALVRPSSPAEHREMLASSARRSRFFVTYPAKFGDGESAGQSEVGARYYEGAAAGAILLGQAPGAAAFRDDFPWEDAVVETRPDGSDVWDKFTSLRDRPEEMANLSVRNAVHALRHHDWGHRWRALLELAGVSPRPALTERLRALDALADVAERAGLHEARPADRCRRVHRHALHPSTPRTWLRGSCDLALAS